MNAELNDHGFILISGYSKPNSIPTEIIKLIAKFYWCINYLLVNNNLTTIDIFTGQSNPKIIQDKYIDTHCYSYHHNTLTIKCAINHISLPKSVQTVINDKMLKSAPFNDNNWSALVEINDNDCQLKYLHSMNESEIVCYEMDAPSFQTPLRNSYFLYDKYNQKIYALISLYYNHFRYNTVNMFYALDLNNYVYPKKWASTKLSIDYKDHQSACMVDKGRFIAIMQSNKLKLLSLKLYKSIDLSDMIHHHQYEPSIYHEKYHKIFIGGTKYFEQYDINKDFWSIFYCRSFAYDHYFNDKTGHQNIWISYSNPNIMYFAGACTCTKKYVVEMFDLRSSNKKIAQKDPKEIFSMSIPNNQDWFNLIL